MQHVCLHAYVYQLKIQVSPVHVQVTSIADLICSVWGQTALSFPAPCVSAPALPVGCPRAPGAGPVELLPRLYREENLQCQYRLFCARKARGGVAFLLKHIQNPRGKHTHRYIYIFKNNVASQGP